MDQQGPETGKRAGDVAPERASLMQAMLVLSGELGYREVSVEQLLERSGAEQFSAYFTSREECFAAAYELEAECLYRDLVGAGAPDSPWREHLRAALASFFTFATDRALLARALLIDVYVAGGPALVKHESVLERLSRALDESACRETSGSRHTPPPITAEFMVGAIEQSVRSFLISREPERIWASLPELMHLIVGPYLGDAAAAEELRRPVERPSP